MKKKVSVFGCAAIIEIEGDWRVGKLGLSTLVNCGCFVRVRIDFTEIEVKGEENLAIAVVY